MFAQNSRYADLETVTVRDAQGREVQAVKLRRLPQTAGAPWGVSSGSRLDVLSQQRYRDATRYWHIADANTELESGALVAASGRTIRVPER